LLVETIKPLLYHDNYRLSGPEKQSIDTTPLAIRPAFPGDCPEARRCLPASLIIAKMWQIRTPARTRTDVLTLETDAERAGFAWACPFSSSAEFEAAVIRSRRRAGAYGPSRGRRYAFYTAAIAAAVAVTAGTYLLT
jgi:hypothetical protein